MPMLQSFTFKQVQSSIHIQKTHMVSSFAVAFNK